MSVELPPETASVLNDDPATNTDSTGLTSDRGPGVCDDPLATTFDTLVGPLFRYARRLLRRADLAEDAVQETFLRLWRSPQPPSDGALAAWLFRVCRNWSLDRLRKDGRMSPLEIGERTAAIAADDPTARVDQHEQVQLVRRSIAQLPEQQQELLRLRFDGQLSYRELAEVTGLSVSHVGVLLHEALSTLRKKLRDHDLPSGVE